MSDKNCLLSNTVSMETESKGFSLQYQNELQNNLGTENKSEASKNSGKMKYVFLAVAVILFIIAGLVLLNILLQFVVIKEIFSVIIIGSSGLFGILSYILYKNIDTKELKLQVQARINTVKQPINKNAKLEIRSEINKLEILSENKSRNIVLNQIIVEKPEYKNVVEQIGSVQILGKKTNMEESDENKVIIQKANNINNKDIENEKLDKLLEQLKGNGLTVEYNFESENWDIKRPENVVEQIDEIEIQGKERPENIFEQIDEITLIARERPENIVESIDEIELTALERPENKVEYIDEIEIIPKQEKIKDKDEQRLNEN